MERKDQRCQQRWLNLPEALRKIVPGRCLRMLATILSFV
jgi:hypothetical protein